jgi:hypothetical protein
MTIRNFEYLFDPTSARLGAGKGQCGVLFL